MVRMTPVVAGLGAAAAVLTGALTASAYPTSPVAPKVPDGAVAQAWAFGTLTAATQAKGTRSCDLAHACELVVEADSLSGWVTIKRQFAPSGAAVFPEHLPFVLHQRVDYPHGTPNGAGGRCFPTTGTLSVDFGSPGTLVLALQGQACQSYGRATAALVVNADYVGAGTSTGEFTNVQAVGSYTSVGPSGLRADLCRPAPCFTTVKASLNGQLLLLNEAKTP